MKTVKTLLVVLLLFPLLTQGQSSPGGVSAGLVNWLDADKDTYSDAGVTPVIDGQKIRQWNDQSTVSNNVAQTTLNNRPTYKFNTTDNINFNPLIDFSNTTSGQEDYFQFASAANLPTGNTDRVYYLVAVPGPGSGTSNAIFHGDWTPANEGRFVGFTFSTTQYHSHFGSCRWGIVNTNNIPQIYAAYFPVGSTVTTDLEFRVNGLEKTESLIGGGARTLNTQPWVGYIGAGSNMGSSTTPQGHWNGQMTEVVLYDSDHTSVSKNKVESYLAIKYGITLGINGTSLDYNSSNSVTVWDVATNTGYNFDIAGIARDDQSSLDQPKSHAINLNGAVSRDIVTVANGTNFSAPSSIANNDSYLVWGHNDGTLTGPYQSPFFNTLNPETIQSLFDRHWKAQETGTIGTVTLEYDMSAVPGVGNVAGANDLNNLRMLVDVDGAFTVGATSISPSFVDSTNNIVQFQHDFTAGTGFFFTLGSINNSTTPLPVELISFTAHITDDQKVKLDWTTGTEINNNYFTVHRSLDVKNWEEVCEVDGAGNSSCLLNYIDYDNEPYLGTSYYRLKQTDFNGASSFSQIETVSFNGVQFINIYPNPSVGDFNFILYSTINSDYSIFIYDKLGRIVFLEEINLKEGSNELRIDISFLSEGSYSIHIKSTDGKYMDHELLMIKR